MEHSSRLFEALAGDIVAGALRDEEEVEQSKEYGQTQVIDEQRAVVWNEDVVDSQEQHVDGVHRH